MVRYAVLGTTGPIVSAVGKPSVRHRAYILCAVFSLCLVVIHLYLSLPAACYELSVGHLPPLRGGRTFLLITDLGGAGPAVKISFYDDLGREVPASPVHKLLPPNGKVQIDVESYLQTVGTVVLESSSEQIAGEYWQMIESGAVFMLPLQYPGEEARYFVNCFRFPYCKRSYIVLSDPCGAGPLVQMEFYNRMGELVKVASKLLRPYGTLALEVSDYVPWDVLGKVSVRSFSGSIVLHYRQLCEGGTVLAVPARSPTDELLVDRFSTGGGITGDLVIADTSAEGPAVKVQFRDASGTVLREQEKLLPPNGTMSIDPADYVGEVPNGTIKISGDSEMIADYWEKSSQTVIDTPAVDRGGAFLVISYFSPFGDTQNLLSLLNIGQGPAKAEVLFYADDGSELRVEEFLLDPYKPVDELVGRYFDGEPFGTIIVKGHGADLVVTSHIFDLKGNRHLGKAHAQVIR